MLSLMVPAAAGARLDERTDRAGQTALRIQSVTPEFRAQSKLRILLEVSRLLSSPEGLKTLPDQILELASRILDIDRAALLVVNEATGQLEPRAVKTSVPAGGPIYSQHVVDHVRREGVAALFADAMSDPRFADARSIAAQSIRASMCVPLQGKDDLLGVLYVDNQSHANRFTKEDLEFLASFGSQAAVALLNDYFPVMADIVFRYEGTLEKYIGDALMAVWGAPFSRVDDADRAVRAAIAMQHALRTLNREWASARPPLQIHFGLNTGPVAAGFLGSQSYLQYAAIGDATNVASRVCTAAPPGELFITDTTWQKLRDKNLPVEKLAPVEVKGKSAALMLYRVRWEQMPVSPEA